MARRIVYQCDRCNWEKEQGDMPRDWVTAEVSQSNRMVNLSPTFKMWCPTCWALINEPLPKAMPKDKGAQ
jgi:hypothetical protein